MPHRANLPVTIRAFCAAVALCAGFASGEIAAEPYLPSRDDLVLERLPAPGAADLRELRDLRRGLDANPEDLGLALRLARRYMDLGRAQADPRYQGYAEAALKPWWDLARPPIEVLVLRAVLHQNRHDFDTARNDLARALAVQPMHAQALLTQAFVLLVQGRYGDALQSCRHLPGGVPQLVVATCTGRAASLTGQAEAGYEALRRALSAAPDSDVRLRLWALTNLAEIAVRLGKSEAAERHFRAALALERRDVYLLGAFADHLLAQGRAGEARALLEGETRVDALLLRLTIAEDRLGRTSAQTHRARLEDRFEASRRRGSALHRREEARFELEVLGRHDEALRLAEANWAVQKEPQDAALVLQAALAAGVPERAAPVAEWIEGTGLEDVSIRALIRRLDGGDG